MSFYGNQIIETNKAFSSIIVRPSSESQDNYITLTPQVQESNLLLAPKDPWIALEANPVRNTIYIYHTTTAQRKRNALAIDNTQPSDILLHDNDYENSYIVPAANNISNPKMLQPGDVFATIAPIDNNKNFIIDNAGHLVNAQIIYYKFASMGSLVYNKNSWVETMYGTDNWYEDNRETLNIDENHIGYIPDLYNKMNSIMGIVSEETSDTISINDLLDLRNNLDKLKVQVNNLYYPDQNKEYIINNETIPPSPLSKAVISIRDCKLKADNENKYLDTEVIEILKGIKDCDFNRTFLQDSSKTLKSEVKMLEILEQFENLKNTIETFLGLEYDTNIISNAYIETEVSQEEFEASPNLYYKLENNSYLNTLIYDPNTIYYTKVNKNLIAIQINADIFNMNKQNLYIQVPDTNHYNSAKRESYSVNTTYYLYTGYTESSCNSLLTAIRCYNNGGTVETITEYINKLNSAR